MIDLLKALPITGGLPRSIKLPARLDQLVAWETGFLALTEEGQVYTWGDDRYSECLGRDCTLDW